MKIFLFLFFISFNVLALDFSNYSIIAKDYEEMKILSSKMQCEIIDNNSAKNCILKVKYKIRENLELIDSPIFIKSASNENLSICFAKYDLKENEKNQKEFSQEINFVEVAFDDKIYINVDYLKLKEMDKIIEKGEKKYIEFCKTIRK
ncbi:MAG: hypothetical protein WHV67_01695 [Thermoanaerobaculia bacterium]